jgi:hypothetical protein
MTFFDPLLKKNEIIFIAKGTLPNNLVAFCREIKKRAYK